jgi:hypothetical protein
MKFKKYTLIRRIYLDRVGKLMVNEENEHGGLVLTDNLSDYLISSYRDYWANTNSE